MILDSIPDCILGKVKIDHKRPCPQRVFRNPWRLRLFSDSEPGNKDLCDAL
jgi:hypothetical protein